MKICLTAIMKNIKSLEEKKERLCREEKENRTTCYINESDKVDTGYDYEFYRKEIDAIDDEILGLRSVLNKANATVKVIGTNYTISEALVRLAQLSAKLNYLSGFPTVKLSRVTTYNGAIEYTECLYSVKTVTETLEKLREDISALQMALDKTNLVYEVDID